MLDYFDTEIEKILNCIGKSLSDCTQQERLSLRVAMMSTKKKSFESGKLAAMESQKFNVKEFIRRCQYRWSFDVKIAAEMLEIAKYTPPVPADKPAVPVPDYKEELYQLREKAELWWLF